MARALLVLLPLSLILAGCPTKPACDASSCIGCCDANGECQSGVAQTACGQFGAACDACVGPQSCQLGRCMLAQGGSGGGSSTGGGGGGGAGGGGAGGGGGGGNATFGPCGARGECTTGVCDRPRNLCLTCRGSIDCEEGDACTNGVCVPATACTSDLDCTSQGKVCDVAGGRCVQCNGSAECPSGQACVGFACAPVVGCTSSLDCTASMQVCAPALPPRFPATVTQACQDCASDNDCPAGSGCVTGMCIDVCGPRVCGFVGGLSCGICPGQGVDQGACLDSGRACLIPVARHGGDVSDGDAVTFVDGKLLWAEWSLSGSVFALDVATGVTETIATGQESTATVGATATTWYWGSGNGVSQRARAGGPVTVAAQFPGDGYCSSLAFAGGQLYCGGSSGTASGLDGVYRAPLAGGGTMTRVVEETIPSVFTHRQDVLWVGLERLGFFDPVADTSTTLLSYGNTVGHQLFAEGTAVYFWRGGLSKIDLSTRQETQLYTREYDEHNLVAGITDGTHAFLVVRLLNSYALRFIKVDLATGRSSKSALPSRSGSTGMALALEPGGLLLGYPGSVYRIAPR